MQHRSVALTAFTGISSRLQTVAKRRNLFNIKSRHVRWLVGSTVRESKQERRLSLSDSQKHDEETPMQS